MSVYVISKVFFRNKIVDTDFISLIESTSTVRAKYKFVGLNLILNPALVYDFKTGGNPVK